MQPELPSSSSSAISMFIPVSVISPNRAVYTRNLSSDSLLYPLAFFAAFCSESSSDIIYSSDWLDNFFLLVTLSLSNQLVIKNKEDVGVFGVVLTSFSNAWKKLFGEIQSSDAGAREYRQQQMFRILRVALKVIKRANKLTFDKKQSAIEKSFFVLVDLHHLNLLAYRVALHFVENGDSFFLGTVLQASDLLENARFYGNEGHLEKNASGRLLRFLIALLYFKEDLIDFAYNFFSPLVKDYFSCGILTVPGIHEFGIACANIAYKRKQVQCAIDFLLFALRVSPEKAQKKQPQLLSSEEGLLLFSITDWTPYPAVKARFQEIVKEIVQSLPEFSAVFSGVDFRDIDNTDAFDLVLTVATEQPLKKFSGFAYKHPELILQIQFEKFDLKLLQKNLRELIEWELLQQRQKQERLSQQQREQVHALEASRPSLFVPSTVVVGSFTAEKPSESSKSVSNRGAKKRGKFGQENPSGAAVVELTTKTLSVVSWSQAGVSSDSEGVYSLSRSPFVPVGRYYGMLDPNLRESLGVKKFGLFSEILGKGRLSREHSQGVIPLGRSVEIAGVTYTMKIKPKGTLGDERVYGRVAGETGENKTKLIVFDAYSPKHGREPGF